MRFKLNRSFTLIEVLITVAILSVVISYLFQSFTTSLYSAQFSQNITLACYLAEERLWEIEQYYLAGEEFPKEGTQTIQNKDFSYIYEILDTENQDLKGLKLKISWREKIREEKYSMEFLTFLSPKK